MSDAETRKAPVQREWRFQEAVATFLSKALPHGAWWSSIDQGRAANARIGAARKARGIHAGLPDVQIAAGGVTLWIELKAGSSLSEAQKTNRDALLANGHKWALARSLDDVEAACRDAGIPLRATLGGIRERIAAQPPVKKRAARTAKAAPRYLMGKRATARARGKGML